MNVLLVLASAVVGTAGAALLIEGTVSKSKPNNVLGPDFDTKEQIAGGVLLSAALWGAYEGLKKRSRG